MIGLNSQGWQSGRGRVGGLAGQKPQPGQDPLSLTGRVRQPEPVKVVSRVGGS